jgi:hypothetical protein
MLMALQVSQRPVQWQIPTSILKLPNSQTVLTVKDVRHCSSVTYVHMLSDRVLHQTNTALIQKKTVSRDWLHVTNRVA